MEFSPERWHALTEAIHRHWPNISDEELKATRGDFISIKELISYKSNMNEKDIRELLASIFEEIQRSPPSTL